MGQRPFILLVDDEPEQLDVYREMLGQLPSRPEVHAAATGARAIAMLEAVAYSVLLCDLKMPAMDGLQVLAIVRRKFPHLRTVIMTGLVDEQFRARAYAMGVDLFIGKPHGPEEVRQFLDCLESLLDLDAPERGGFRGVQKKSLMDIIQLECLCKSSAVLRIHNENNEGRIWFDNGDIVDAEVTSLEGEDAFRKILSWRTGNFEILPAEAGRQRRILDSYQGLLLSSAQALDEAQAPAGEGPAEAVTPALPQRKRLCHFEGVEFGLVRSVDAAGPGDAWAMEDGEAARRWLHDTLSAFRTLGEELQVGDLQHLDAATSQHRLVLTGRGEREFLVAFDKAAPAARQTQVLRDLMTEWAS